ncbi:uncharacterized protein LOC135080767 isoform X2 [Ostrinia nubilalis]|uniref:uncharacterized protein LOC135080767 isoform X2 n=1 Tax=Ostrinia nubilalis TaxID=29057 RepID=UPI0030825013
MEIKVFFLIFAATFASSFDIDKSQVINILNITRATRISIEPTNYDVSRNRLLGNSPSNGFGIRDFLDFLLAGSYGQYYPNGPGGYYPGGNYPGGNYQGYNPGLAGPPGAHPGCPLCDSSVYSYCSYKQAHDACCCDNPSYMPFTCRKSSCGFLYANSCQEYNLISSCCCVDLYKNGGVPPVQPPIPVVA